ncbi:hypothetical protein EJ110_NYTH27313 [Nymphaea thermarum]|nr:hypothetical protein EJ110_NYTH27313 [Nymphaea thermarum]
METAVHVPPMESDHAFHMGVIRLYQPESSRKRKEGEGEEKKEEEEEEEDDRGEKEGTQAYQSHHDEQRGTCNPEKYAKTSGEPSAMAGMGCLNSVKRNCGDLGQRLTKVDTRMQTMISKMASMLCEVLQRVDSNSSQQSTSNQQHNPDAIVVAFRKWLRKYSNGQIEWDTKFGRPPPTLPREQLMDRYYSHVVNCSSCRAAVTALKALEFCLQVLPIALIGIVAVANGTTVSSVVRKALVFTAVLCFVASKWLGNFIYKTFYFHDYNHAFK